MITCDFIIHVIFRPAVVVRLDQLTVKYKCRKSLCTFIRFINFTYIKLC